MTTEGVDMVFYSLREPQSLYSHVIPKDTAFAAEMKTEWSAGAPQARSNHFCFLHMCASSMSADRFRTSSVTDVRHPQTVYADCLLYDVLAV